MPTLNSSANWLNYSLRAKHEFRTCFYATSHWITREPPWISNTINHTSPALFVLASLILLAGCSSAGYNSAPSDEVNPFLKDWHGQHQLPPFEEIRVPHFQPAYDAGVAELQQEIDAITANPNAPAFANTIIALERAGDTINRVASVMYHLLSTMRTDELSAASKPIISGLSKVFTDVYSNPELFARVKALYDRRNSLGLDGDEMRLLEEYHRDFVRSGALLTSQELTRFKEINQRLSELSTQFGENVTTDTYAKAVFVDDFAIIKNLPEAAIKAAKAEAEKRERPESWAFTAARVSMYPFLQHATSPQLRSELYSLYTDRGNRGGETDNNAIIVETLKLRQERAELLGYPDHTSYVLETRTAPSEQAILEFIDQVWQPSLSAAKRDLRVMKSMAIVEENISEFAASDWWYYAERLKERRYKIDSERVSEYFPVDSVIEGVFGLATRLFGLTFSEMRDVQVWEPSVRVFRVADRNGDFVGIYYADFYARPSKRGGAWMNSFHVQHRMDGKEVYPVVLNVCNFPQPSGDKPALLTLEQTTTFFHEFGHALHGLLSNVRYPSQSGTSTPRDYVEMPSQVYENWALEPEFVPTYARHYQTGEPIPQQLITRIEQSKRHNLGFRRVEYLAASLLDLKLHSLKGDIDDVSAAEAAIMESVGAMPEIVPRYRSGYFQHIFSGGYSSGYYSYLWAEVLDADAFALFQKRGLFDPATAQDFVDHVFSIGGSKDVLVEFEKFLGRSPQTDALLKRDGFK